MKGVWIRREWRLIPVPTFRSGPCADYPIREIVGHRDLSPDLDGDGVVEPEEWVKQCPCFDVASEREEWLGKRPLKEFKP